MIRLGTSGGVQTDVTPGSHGNGSSYALGLDSTGIYYEAAMLNDPVIVKRIEIESC